MEEEEEEDEEEDTAFWHLFNFILNATEDDISLSEPFMRLPNRKTYPDYYLEIPKPICLVQVSLFNLEGRIWFDLCVRLCVRLCVLTCVCACL